MARISRGVGYKWGGGGVIWLWCCTLCRWLSPPDPGLTSLRCRQRGELVLRSFAVLCPSPPTSVSGIPEMAYISAPSSAISNLSTRNFHHPHAPGAPETAAHHRGVALSDAGHSPCVTFPVVTGPPHFTALGKTECAASPAPAREGRRGEEAAAVRDSCPTLTYQLLSPVAWDTHCRQMYFMKSQ